MAKRHGNKKIGLILKKGQVVHRGYTSKYIDEDEPIEGGEAKIKSDN